MNRVAAWQPKDSIVGHKQSLGYRTEVWRPSCWAGQLYVFRGHEGGQWCIEPPNVAVDVPAGLISTWQRLVLLFESNQKYYTLHSCNGHAKRGWRGWLKQLSLHRAWTDNTNQLLLSDIARSKTNLREKWAQLRFELQGAVMYCGKAPKLQLLAGSQEITNALKPHAFTHIGLHAHNVALSSNLSLHQAKALSIISSKQALTRFWNLWFLDHTYPFIAAPGKSWLSITIN